MTVSRRTRLVLSAAVLALAGCQSAAPTTPGEGRVSSNAPISNGGGQADQGSLDGPITKGARPGTGIVATGGSSVTADGKPVAVDVAVGRTDDGVPVGEARPVAGSTGMRDTALAGAGATRARIDAAIGAVVATPDGKLILTIPPGALSADADVRVAPLETASMPVPNVYTPAIRFALDLGGAQIAPDATLKVKQAVDPRFVSELQKRNPAFDAAAYGLSQDAGGEWVLEMPIHGPASASAKAPSEPVDLAGMLLAEFGHLPYAPGPAGSQPTFKLQATPAEQFETTYGKPAPTSMDQWFAYEQSGVFDCGTIESTCWGIDLLASLNFPIGRSSDCGPGGEPSSPPGQPGFLRVDVPTSVTFTSDDPAVAGKPAAGATVTFEMLQSRLNGPRQVIADAQGMAGTFTVDGSQVSAMAQIDVGPRSGAWVAARARAGMAPLALTVAKNSPHLDLDLESDVPLGALLEVQYQLDEKRDAATLSIPKPLAKEDRVRLVVHVPDDARHTFKITGVGGGQQTLLEALPGALDVQRNGTYTVKLKLAGVAQK